MVVVGSANMDLVVRAAGLPASGETLLGSGFETCAGGKGANQAIAAARLGASVAMVGCVGDDAFGATLRDALTSDRIDTAHVQRIPATSSGIAMITVAADGANTIVVAPGANARLTPELVDAAGELIAHAGMLICQLEVPLGAVRRAIDTAARHGTPVLLNPAPAQPLPDDLYAQIDVLIVNETEAQVLAGVAVSDAATACRAANALRAKGAHTVIVTLGAGGAWYAGPEGEGHMAAPRVDAVDTTAAGDTFAGGFAAARVRGAPLCDAIAFGQRAAALSVMRKGAQTSIPTRAELDAQLPAA
ncbi:ribokinase [Paraburkholderia panacisoli]|uniref:Ribokinase n=1 Tax=Paraburkholderia panacisoli TaxID=2603818 RepID=A0A5B0HFE2_9BURK|nr:ribokinase [Paraburkholderia panacisoli]KAA1013802.1 ribokinase [Paraburkholderia panacisoli]